MNQTNASDDSILILKYLIVSKKLSDLTKKSIDSTEYLNKIKLDLNLQSREYSKEPLKRCAEAIKDLKRYIKEFKKPNCLERCESPDPLIEMLKEELINIKYLKEEIEEIGEYIENIKTSLNHSSIKKIEICLDHNNSISIKENSQPDLDFV